MDVVVKRDMLNIEQFARVVIYSYGLQLAQPGHVGPAFTWEESFPSMAVGYVKSQWWMANRQERVFLKNEAKVRAIAVEVGKLIGNIVT